MSLIDTVFYLDQLPNETSPRIGYEAYKCMSGDGSFIDVIPYIPVMGYQKQRVKDLSKAGFFSNGSFNQDIFDKFIERQSPDKIKEEFERLTALNQNRINNYQLSVDLLEELRERDPLKPDVVININKTGNYLIKEGGLLLAKINLKNKGSGNHSYAILNHNSDQLGEINIFQNPETKNGLKQMKYNVKLFAIGKNNSQENYIWFYERVRSVGIQNSSTHSKLLEIATYLVDNGFL